MVLGPLVTAFGFLTRLPVPAADGSLAGAIRWFPLVGAVVGAIVGATLIGAAALVDAPLAGAVAVTAGIVVTGALHEDGLGDTADGFGGGWTVADRLEIMADPRQGTYGVAAIGSLLLIRAAALGGLASDGWVAVVVIAAVHLQARNLAGLALAAARPARPGGLADVARTGVRSGRLVAAGWTVVAIGMLVLGGGPLAAVAVVGTGAIAAGAVIAVAYRAIGGVTGDVLGAVEQVAEATGLVAAVAILDAAL